MGRPRYIAEFLAERDNDLVERARGAVVGLAPHLVQQAVAREHLAGMRVEELQQLQLLRGKPLDCFSPPELERLRVNCRVTDAEGHVTVAANARLKKD